MSKKDQYDDMFDHMLKYAAEQRMEDMANSYPFDDDFNKEPSFSPEFNSHMQSYFKKLKRKGKTHQLTRVALRVAIFIIVFLGASTVVIFNVEALRVPFINLFSKNGDESITINVRDEKADYNSFRDQISGMYLPTFVPEDYHVDSINVTDSLYLIVYIDVEGDQIILQKLLEGCSVVKDNEDVNFKNITVNDAPAQYFEKNGMRTIIYTYNKDYYLINGTISEYELVHIAESMEYYP